MRKDEPSEWPGLPNRRGEQPDRVRANIFLLGCAIDGERRPAGVTWSTRTISGKRLGRTHRQLREISSTVYPRATRPYGGRFRSRAGPTSLFWSPAANPWAI